ncbi:hypothetical protein F5B18DRAFT_637470 [Nemania serpens]|nr:hypothetical protein F5B18DRAFT_637470 [Nemania serpens]
MAINTATDGVAHTGTDTKTVLHDAIRIDTSVSCASSHSLATDTLTSQVLLVYNVSSRSTFNRIQQLFQLVERARTTDVPLPAVIVGNKYNGSDREVSAQEGEALAKTLGCVFIETAVEGENVAVAVMVRQLEVAQ